MDTNRLGIPWTCLFLTALTASSHFASACSCGYISVEEAYRFADAVFLGRVTSVLPHADGEVPGDSYNAEIITFQVLQRWKGVERETEEVRTWLNCGIFGDPGDLMVVYAHIREEDEMLWAGMCGRTSSQRTWMREACQLEREGFEPIIVAEEASYECADLPPVNFSCGFGGFPLFGATLLSLLAVRSRRITVGRQLAGVRR